MHLLVIAAFALVLATPPQGWPWTPENLPPRTTLLVVAGQLLLFLVLIAVGTVATLRRLRNAGTGESDGQRFFGRFQFAWRLVLLANTVVLVQLTPWVQLVRDTPIGPDGWKIGHLWGVPDLLVLTPFLMAAIGAWAIQFPVDRVIREQGAAAALWEGRPVRPVWRFRQYLLFHIRNGLLLIVVPMAAVLVLRDAQPYYGSALTRWVGDPAVGHLAFLAGVGLVFVVSPLVMCWIWSTEALPPGELRDRLERLCQRIGLRYRRILIWKSEGVMVNAAVMGLAGPLRFILLSDGLLESMDDKKVEAVFGHEAGHVVHYHIPYYLIFAVLSMLVAGGSMLLLLEWLPDSWLYFEAMLPMILLALIWLVGFGWISRRFERQADLYGARCVTPDATRCERPCRVHNRAGNEEDKVDPDPPAANGGHPNQALCSTAAETFAEALERIASLNGIPPEARSWRHSSIASRARFLRSLADDPARLQRFQRLVWSIKAFLAVGIGIALPLTVYLYLIDRLPRQLLGF